MDCLSELLRRETLHDLLGPVPMVHVKVNNGYFPTRVQTVWHLLNLVAVDALEVGSCNCHVVDETKAVREGLRVAEHLMFKVTSVINDHMAYLVFPKTPA